MDQCLPSSVAEPAVPAAHGRRPGGPVVVVAEDDAEIRALVVRKLRSIGIEVIEASSGLAALALVRTGKPDLVVLDVVLPGLSGIEVCRAIKSAPGSAAVPVFLMSAAASPEDIRSGLAAGAEEYMVKPFSPRNLAERVGLAVAKGGPS